MLHTVSSGGFSPATHKSQGGPAHGGLRFARKRNGLCLFTSRLLVLPIVIKARLTITWNAYLSIYTEKQNFPEEHNTGASLLLLFNENIY